MDAVSWDIHWRCQQSTYRAFLTRAHRFLFVYLITVLLISSAERGPERNSQKIYLFIRKQTQIRRAKAGQTFEWITSGSISQNDSSQEHSRPYKHGLVSLGRIFAWPNSQTCGAPPAAWLLTDEAKTLTLRGESLADQGLIWSALPLTVAWLDQGRARGSSGNSLAGLLVSDAGLTESICLVVLQLSEWLLPVVQGFGLFVIKGWKGSHEVIQCNLLLWCPRNLIRQFKPSFFLSTRRKFCALQTNLKFIELASLKDFPAHLLSWWLTNHYIDLDIKSI